MVVKKVWREYEVAHLPLHLQTTDSSGVSQTFTRMLFVFLLVRHGPSCRETSWVANSQFGGEDGVEVWRQRIRQAYASLEKGWSSLLSFIFSFKVIAIHYHSLFCHNTSLQNVFVILFEKCMLVRFANNNLTNETFYYTVENYYSLMSLVFS